MGKVFLINFIIKSVNCNQFQTPTTSPSGRKAKSLEREKEEKFRSRRCGSSFPGLRMLDPLLGATFRRMCLQSHLQTSPTNPQKSFPKFWIPRRTFENTPLFCPNIEDRGGPRFLLVDLNPNIFVS